MHEIEIEVITKRIRTLEPYLDWYSLCGNSSINYEILSKFTDKDKEIDYEYMSQNPYITIKIILNNLDKAWDWHKISANKSITFKDILDNPNLPWKWKGLFENPNLCAEDFIDNPGPWTLSWGDNNNHDFIKSGFSKEDSDSDSDSSKSTDSDSDSDSSKSTDSYYDFEYFEDNIINIDFIHEKYNPKWRWTNLDWYYISSNKGITLQDYLNNKNKYEWNLKGLSENPNITIKDVIENPQIKWDSEALSNNPNITIKDVLENPQIKWDFYELMFNDNITIKDILENPQLNWNMDWDHFTIKLLGETIDILEKYSDKPWNYNKISYNSNITFEYVIKNIDKNWDWKYLSRNPAPFKIRSTDPDLLACAREFFAARKIQRQWHRVIADPTWELCRRRLRREFSDLVS